MRAILVRARHPDATVQCDTGANIAAILERS
jgi:hypothetical protein